MENCQIYGGQLNYPHSYSLIEMVWMLVEIIIRVEGGNFEREVSHMLA